MDLYEGLFVNVNCPNCGYGMDVQLLSAYLQEMIFCPCCKVKIQLVDHEASLHGALEDTKLAINRLQREIKAAENNY